ARILLGFFQATDVAGYVAASGIPIDDLDQDDVAAARQFVSKIPTRLGPRVSPLSDSQHTSEVRKEITFAAPAVSATDEEFAHVEVRRQPASQPQVDLAPNERLRAGAPELGDYESVLKFCLPLQRDGSPFAPQSNFNPITNTFTMVVDNPDV